MLYFTQNGVTLETDSDSKTWSLPELLEMSDPLPGLPLAERNAAMRKVADLAAVDSGNLSETARLRVDFWQNFQPGKIAERTYQYSSNADSTKLWELTVNALGLFFKDISGAYYYPPGKVTEQLFSDFWFYGPLQPVPELNMRKKILELIRETFLDPDCPAARAHFELFEYPKGSSLSWSEGDYNRMDYVDVVSCGIETGYSTWRENQPSMWFTSFEYFLNEPPRPYSSITPEIRAEIEQFLGRKSRFSRPETEAPTTSKPPTPLEKMNLDETVVIVNPISEKVEPFSDGNSRVKQPATETPSPREKMDLAETILKADAHSEKGAEILISLLEYEAEESYWRNYVFQYCFKLRGNGRVEKFILDCLRGDHETHFKKAVDVLQMWGFYGDKSFQNRALLQQLNWEDATASDPDFREALKQTIKILDHQSSGKHGSE